MLPTSGDMHSKLFFIVIIICDLHTTVQTHVADNTMSAHGTFRLCENDIKIGNQCRFNDPVELGSMLLYVRVYICHLIQNIYRSDAVID